MVIDSRSCRSAPSCAARGIDGGKKIHDVKIQMATLTNTASLWRSMSRRRTGMTPKPSFRFCVSSPDGGGFQGPALGDLGLPQGQTAGRGPVRHSASPKSKAYRSRAAETDSSFPPGICWLIERSFAWLIRYRLLNTIFERSKEHLIAFVAIAFISILSRRLKRLVVEELRA